VHGHSAAAAGLSDISVWSAPAGTRRTAVVLLRFRISMVGMAVGFPIPVQNKTDNINGGEAVARPLAACLQQWDGWPSPQGYPHRPQLRV
jgi:hypothetical protein